MCFRFELSLTVLKLFSKIWVNPWNFEQILAVFAFLSARWRLPIHLQLLIFRLLRLRLVLQLSGRLNWRLQNMTKSPAIIFSFLWHVKWQVFDAPRQLISFMNSAIEFRPQQVTRGSHHFFFKDCQSRFRKVMQPVLSEHFLLWPSWLIYATTRFYIFIFLFILFLTMISYFLYTPGSLFGFCLGCCCTSYNARGLYVGWSKCIWACGVFVN